MRYLIIIKQIKSVYIKFKYLARIQYKNEIMLRWIIYSKGKEIFLESKNKIFIQNVH